MAAKVLTFPMAEESLHPFPSERTEARTGSHSCTVCLQPVESDEYFGFDHAHEVCADRPESDPSAPSGWRPVDRPEVRAEIERRGVTTYP